MIFIDTNIVIEYLKNKSFLEDYDFEDLFINDIVIMELYQGAKNIAFFAQRNIKPYKSLCKYQQVIKCFINFSELKIL